jgi:hypothetical protein
MSIASSIQIREEAFRAGQTSSTPKDSVVRDGRSSPLGAGLGVHESLFVFDEGVEVSL